MNANTPVGIKPEVTAFDFLPQMQFVAIINEAGNVEIHSTFDERCLVEVNFSCLETGEGLLDGSKLDLGDQLAYELMLGDLELRHN